MKAIILFFGVITSSILAFAATAKIGTLRLSDLCSSGFYLEEVNDSRTCVEIDPKVLVGPWSLEELVNTNVELHGTMTNGVFLIRGIVRH